jgi:hypothetical protein
MSDLNSLLEKMHGTAPQGFADIDPGANQPQNLMKSGAANKRFQTLINTLAEHLEPLGDAAGEVVEQAAKNRNGRLANELVTRKYFIEEVQAAADARRAEVRVPLQLPNG